MKNQLFLFILFLLPLTASADDSGTCGRNLTWTYVEATHTLTISGSGEMNNYSYHTNLAPWSGYHEEISTIIIESGVTRIGEYAFYDCSSMVTIDIPNSVTSIGVSAFDNCVNLKSIDIPNSVTNIEDGAFLNCRSLSSINIPNGVTSIGVYTFSGCSSLTSIAIPNSVTSIGVYAFSGCSSLTSIVIPNSVTSIGEYAFSGCSSLTSIDIPNSVTSIGEYLVSGCSSLESVVIGEGLASIIWNAFYQCDNLKSITLGSNISCIYGGNFNECKELKVVTCKAKAVPELRSDVFSDCNLGNAKLIVPDESINAYKAASVWKDFGTIVGLRGYSPDTQKCATPTIHYANGQLTFECATEGVTYHTTITDPDITSYSSNTISLSGKYIVKVYATKQGLEKSDTATAEINLLEGSGSGIKGDVNNDKYVNMSDVTDIIDIILER